MQFTLENITIWNAIHPIIGEFIFIEKAFAGFGYSLFFKKNK